MSEIVQWSRIEDCGSSDPGSNPGLGPKGFEGC